MMPPVIWIGIAVLVLILFVFVKFRDFKHKIFAVGVFLLLLFLFLSIAAVASKQSIDYKDFKSYIGFAKAYGIWVKGLVTNFAGITANAVKMDWTPENSNVVQEVNASQIKGTK